MTRSGGSPAPRGPGASRGSTTSISTAPIIRTPRELWRARCLAWVGRSISSSARFRTRTPPRCCESSDRSPPRFIIARPPRRAPLPRQLSRGSGRARRTRHLPPRWQRAGGSLAWSSAAALSIWSGSCARCSSGKSGPACPPSGSERAFAGSADESYFFVVRRLDLRPPDERDLAQIPFKSLYAKEIYDAPTADGWMLQISRYRPVPQSWEQPIFGEPLLLVPGWSQNRHCFTCGAFVKQLLAYGADIHILELRGHGRSSRNLQIDRGLHPPDLDWGWDLDSY